LWSDKPNWLNTNNRRFRALWAEYNTLPRVVQRPKLLSNDMDDAIDSLIDPTATANDDAAEDKYDKWKRSEPRAEKGSNHARNPIQY
jgi:hypothetical protein